MMRCGILIFVLATTVSLAFAQQAASAPSAPASVPNAPAASQPAPDGKAPRLICPEPTINFGEAPAMSAVKASFVLKNGGDAPLNISRVKATCGCTVAKLAKDVLEPGEETHVDATLTLSSHAGKTAKTILVYSNDLKAPSYRLTITGTAVDFIKLNPTRVSFGKTSGDKPSVRELILEPVTEEAQFDLPKIESDSDKIDVDVKPRDEGKGYVVTVRTKPPLPNGYFKGTLTIRTNNKILPVLAVPFDAHVMGKIAVAPQEIVLYEQPPGRPARARFINIAPGSQPAFEVTGATTTVEGVTPEVILQDKNRYLVKLPNLAPTQENNGKKVVITTNVEGYEKIVVPIKVTRHPAHRMRPKKPAAAKAAPTASPAPKP